MNDDTINLITAISNDDEVESSTIFEAIICEKVANKISTKKKDVAKDLIAQALRDKNVHVRIAAAKNAVDPAHHALAMNDKHLHVKLAVLSNPHLYAKPAEEDKTKKSPLQGLIKHISKFKEEGK